MRLPAVQAKVFSTSSVTVGPARSIASSVFSAYDEPDRACSNASTIYRESNPVRVIDVFVEWIDLAEMGFAGIELAARYHPGALTCRTPSHAGSMPCS